MKSIVVVLVFLFISGCASTAFKSRYEKTGKFDADSIYNIDKKASEMKWDDAKDVDVYIGDLPESDTGKDGFITFESKKWEVIGKVTASPQPPGALATNYPEDESWRSYYCPPNAVLIYGTLTLWTLTPFPWTCSVRETNDLDDVNARKIRLINTMKKSVKAAGGNLLVVTSLGHIEYKNLTGQVINTQDMMYAEGLVLKEI